jgi:hypothetical protein
MLICKRGPTPAAAAAFARFARSLSCCLRASLGVAHNNNATPALHNAAATPPGRKNDRLGVSTGVCARVASHRREERAEPTASESRAARSEVAIGPTGGRVPRSVPSRDAHNGRERLKTVGDRTATP